MSHRAEPAELGPEMQQAPRPEGLRGLLLKFRPGAVEITGSGRIRFR
jgi:hypothetical protein